MTDRTNPQESSSSSIMYIVIGIAVLLMAAIVPFAMKDRSMAPSADNEDANTRIQPVARFALTKAEAKASGPRNGATVYGAVCQACHASGAAGAPKAGDKAAWAQRVARGKAELVKSVLNGKGAMPPKGGGADLTEDEIKAAVEHLLGLAK